MVDQGEPLKERRRHPRINRNIPVKICGEEFDAVTETKNLSRSGVFCRVNKYIEPMTKLKIQLLLSYKKKDKMVTKKVSCQGVIVRSDAVPGENTYNTAIYFNDIADKEANAIAEYVAAVITKEDNL
ncbi:MAG TPA: PilZ domain-containing protein [Candidatus Bathyarchaeia archaeon]|nr:PilZ domain-containing protein [Candidatus Bathyarchaeia archaeon]